MSPSEQTERLVAAGISGPLASALECARVLAPAVYAEVTAADPTPEPESGPRNAEELDLRASAMPMAFLCPGSIRRPKIRIRETGEAANLGTATHEALRPLAEVGVPAWDALPALASQYDVDPDELRMLVAMGAKLWKQIERSFPNAMTEVDIEADGLTGHADVLSISGNVARGLDWKSGRKDSDYSEQMRAYCALVLQTHPDVDSVTFTLGWLRSCEIETYTMTRAGMGAWLSHLHSHVVMWNGVYHPGPVCQYCPRGHECEARSALVRRSIADVAGATVDGQALAAMTDIDKIDLYAKAKMIADVADKVRGALKAHVEQTGDVVANGQRLTIETQQQRKLNTLEAFDVLSAAGFDDAAWQQCMSISLSKAEKIAKDRAPSRGGAAAIRGLDEKLETAGAIRQVEIRKLTLRRG